MTDLNSKEETLIIKSEDLMECRDRFLHTLKGFFHNIHNDQQCCSNALGILLECCNWDLDTIAQPMNSWEYLQNRLQQGSWLAFLYRAKKIPLLGRKARSQILGTIYLICDTVQTYIIALHETELMASKFPANPNVISVLLKESQENRDLASDFLDRMVNKFFPQIKEFVKNKKMAHQALGKALQMTIQTRRAGQLEKSQFKLLYSLINNRIRILQNFNPVEQIKPRSYVETISLFQSLYECLSPHLPKLLQSLQQSVYQPSEFIFKKQDKAKFIHILIRGQVVQCDYSAASQNSQTRKLSWELQST